jgi:hypothetical protein
VRVLPIPLAAVPKKPGGKQVSHWIRVKGGNGLSTHPFAAVGCCLSFWRTVCICS